MRIKVAVEAPVCINKDKPLAAVRQINRVLVVAHMVDMFKNLLHG